jgi:hypothetical protein
VDSQVVELAVRLGEVAVRNTAGRIADRLQAAKARRNDVEVIAEMEEIISGLIADKNEVVQIAQALEEKLVAQRVSETEINYVTSNLVPLIEQVANASAPGDTSMQESIDLFKPLLSEETLTVLQLLGFNFKQALGEPLTVLLRELILAQVPQRTSEDAAVVNQKQTLEALRLAQDPEAFARFQALWGTQS